MNEVIPTVGERQQLLTAMAFPNGKRAAQSAGRNSGLRLRKTALENASNPRLLSEAI
jgi:hypothetical protein